MIEKMTVHIKVG